MKQRIGIYQVKATLSKLLKAVRENNVSYEITDRGVPVALLTPITKEESFNERLNEMINSGIICLPKVESQINSIAKRKGAVSRFLEERE